MFKKGAQHTHFSWLTIFYRFSLLGVLVWSTNPHENLSCGSYVVIDTVKFYNFYCQLYFSWILCSIIILHHVYSIMHDSEVIGSWPWILIFVSVVQSKMKRGSGTSPALTNSPAMAPTLHGNFPSSIKNNNRFGLCKSL